jgi:hypothetical protein
MNNDAFQKLVRERSNVKSSKEIAREAVQEEFRKRRGRQQHQRRGGGGGSDDDDEVGSSDEEGGGGRRNKQQDKRSKNRSNNDEEDAKQKDEKDTYRDRAKERRETPGITAEQNKQGDGGLVKGLDLNLARSFKKQTYVKGTNNSGKDEKASFVQNRQEALEFISSSGSSSTAAAPIKSELGKEMLEYLRSTFLKGNAKSIAATPAGMAIQQSVLTFSIHANPGDTARAWEVPREQTYASIDCRRLYEKASPCGSNNGILVLESMESALERNNKKSTHLQQTKAAEKESKQPTLDGDGDDDDDDIFGDVGDYDPLSEMSTANKNEDTNVDDGKTTRPKVDKGSLFEQADGSKDEEVAAHSLVSVETGVEEGEDMIQTSTRLVGLSSSASGAAGYGDDEMDVDFDGRIQDDEEADAEAGNKNKKKKRKRKKGSGSDED